MESLFNTESGFSYYLTSKLSEIEKHWLIDAKIPVLLSIPYLKALESTRPSNLVIMYGYCTRQNKTLAIFQLQIVEFDAENRLRLQMETGKSTSLSDRLALAIKLFVARKVNVNASILGNLMTAGPYGIVFSDSAIIDERRQIVCELCCNLLRKFKILAHTQIVVIKDIDPQLRLIKKEQNPLLRLHEFTIQPSMKLNLRQHWLSMEDYLNDLESKYRSKVKKALLNRQQLEVVDADYQWILEHQDDLFRLYKQIADSAGFNLVELQKEYFAETKKQVPDHFKVKLIYYQKKLIAFYSYFLEGNFVNAHFVGFDKSLNNNLDLYRNILLYYVDDAINNRVKYIEFARTALEMKSSIGAEPIDYYCYLSHESKIMNKLVPGILDLLVPVKLWKPRSPFKNT
ncbi:MAG: hypothetical protein IT267_02130 [Saprospiraceae bacterium]|nr:hypothetical protein [Saprospiraceae bacterium]